jgi:hypothetical protein
MIRSCSFMFVDASTLALSCSFVLVCACSGSFVVRVRGSGPSIELLMSETSTLTDTVNQSCSCNLMRDKRTGCFLKLSWNACIWSGSKDTLHL